MSTLRWAVMGTGRIAAGVLPRLAEAPGGEITAISSRVKARAETLARESGSLVQQISPSRAACTYEELLTRSDVDAVYITLPNHLHFEWSLRLLEAGKHVLCEKPLVAREAEALALAESSRRNRKLCVEGFMYLHHPQSIRLAQIGTQGDASPIGKLLKVRSHRNVHNTDAYILNTRLSHALHGGAIMDIGCYPISAARLAAGSEPDPATIKAYAEFAPPRPNETGLVDETAEFSWTFRNGVHFEGACSFSKGEKAIDIFVELIGDRGIARTEFPFSPDPVHQVLMVNGIPEVFDNGGEKFTNQFAHFNLAAQGMAEPWPSIEWSVGQAATIEAIHRAIGLRF